MDQREFLALMEEVDNELAAGGIAVHARAFHALPSLIGNYEGPIFPTNDEDAARYSAFEGPNLLRSISDWYIHRYGDRAKMPTDLGKVPVTIRGQIYLVRIP